MRHIRIAYICHFSTEQIRQHLCLISLRWGNTLRSLWNLPQVNYSDLGVWNADIIKAFEDNDEFECHVIFSHLGMKKKKQLFEINGVKYVALQGKENVIYKVCKTIFRRSVKDDSADFANLIKKEVDIINPDIIVVCGAENPIYSSSIPLIKGKPVFVILQTLLNDPKRIQMGIGSEMRRELERSVFRCANYFGTSIQDEVEYIRSQNPNAQCLRFVFPSSVPTCIKPVRKDFDFVFFSSGLSKNKGTEDALRAFAYVKQFKQQASLYMIGSCDSSYFSFLKKLIEEFKLENSIVFHGPFRKREEVFSEIMRAKYAILPGITALLNSTVRESMCLGLPVIVYDNPQIQIINKCERCLLAAEKENVKDLGAKMLYAYNHPLEMSTMAINAQQYASDNFSKEAIRKILGLEIQAIIGHYYNNHVIPEQLLSKKLLL